MSYDNPNIESMIVWHNISRYVVEENIFKKSVLLNDSIDGPGL